MEKRQLHSKRIYCSYLKVMLDFTNIYLNLTTSLNRYFFALNKLNKLIEPIQIRIPFELSATFE